MNRKERRRTSHKLGIQQFQQKLSRNKKFELMRGNITAGKQKQKEYKEYLRQQDNKYIEEKESQIIYHMAEDIAKQKNIPIIEALDEARIEYSKL